MIISKHEKFFKHVINELTNQGSDYVFLNGHPIDIRTRKFKLWRKMLAEGNLRCHFCKTPVTEIKLVVCRGSGKIYKPTGVTKRTFKLYGGNGREMTLDHLIPKSFLRKNGLNWNMIDNIVLMCSPCNHFKADAIPANWKEMYNRMNDSSIVPKGFYYSKEIRKQRKETELCYS